MSDNKTKVTVNAKELASIIDDDRAQQMYSRKGGRWVAIIELKHSERHEKVDGDRRVNLTVDQLELVDDGILDGRAVDHVRDIMAALHRNRKLSEDGPQLPIGQDGPEPTVSEVLAARGALVEDDERGPKLWDGESMPEDEDAGDPEPDDPAFEPHVYEAGPDDSCGFHGCGQAYGADIHVHDREPATT